jgi:hypothetical protein
MYFSNSSINLFPDICYKVKRSDDLGLCVYAKNKFCPALRNSESYDDAVALEESLLTKNVYLAAGHVIAQH